jgi:hypothetical protein
LFPFLCHGRKGKKNKQNIGRWCHFVRLALSFKTLFRSRLFGTVSNRIPVIWGGLLLYMESEEISLSIPCIRCLFFFLLDRWVWPLSSSKASLPSNLPSQHRAKSFSRCLISWTAFLFLFFFFWLSPIVVSSIFFLFVTFFWAIGRYPEKEITSWEKRER